MSKSKKDEPKSDKLQKEELKVIKDFQELGRIVVEDLNDYFDNDLMVSARRRRRD